MTRTKKAGQNSKSMSNLMNQVNKLATKVDKLEKENKRMKSEYKKIKSEYVSDKIRIEEIDSLQEDLLYENKLLRNGIKKIGRELGVDLPVQIRDFDLG